MPRVDVTPRFKRRLTVTDNLCLKTSTISIPHKDTVHTYHDSCNYRRSGKSTAVRAKGVQN